MTTRQLVQDIPGQPVGDDFTQIHGIGPGIANRLHNAGILRFTQLASLSPEEIVAATGGLIGLTIERVEQQDWAGQARGLSVARFEALTDENGGHLHYTTFTLELLLDEANRVRRTRLVDVRAGVEDAWAGWDAGRLVQFVTEQSGLNPEAPFDTEQPVTGETDLALEELQDMELDRPVVNEPEEIAPASLTMEETNAIEIVSPPEEHKPGVVEIDRLVALKSTSSLSNHVLPSDRPFTLAMTLNLSQANLSSEPLVHCKATIMAKEFSTGTRFILAEWDETEKPQDEIELSLQHGGLPSGVYRMEAAVVIGPASTNTLTSNHITAFREGQILQVF